MNAPAVTVLMPVYNAETYVAEAIESILAQAFADFEFLIIDDASTDHTPSILAQYARKDSRIRLEKNERNLRIAATLNKGLQLAVAPLIARMDADDAVMPDRLEKQVAFMRANPEVTVCGGALAVYDEYGEVWSPPLEHDAIRAQLLFESCIYHPLVMYRKQQISSWAGGYDEAMPPAEDYDLWARLSMHPDARFANLPDILCKYRAYDKSERYKEVQQDTANLVRKNLLRHIGLTPGNDEFAAHLALSLWRRNLSFVEVSACKKWLGKLHKAALGGQPPCGNKKLEQELERRWFMLCRNNFSASIFGLFYFCSRFFSLKLSIDSVKRYLRTVWKSICFKPA